MFFLLFALWLHYTPAAENVNSSIAQKSAADFMQIDETDIAIKNPGQL